MKKIRYFAGFIFTLIIILLINTVLTKQFGRSLEQSVASSLSQSNDGFQDEIIEALEEAADEMNQSAPTMVDDQTRFDRATVGPGVKVNYHLSLPNYASDEIDQDVAVPELEKSVKSSVCNNENMQAALDMGAVYTYSYSGNDQKVFTSFEVSREDCD